MWKLKDLKIGDVFYFQGRKGKKYKVVGKEDGRTIFTSVDGLKIPDDVGEGSYVVIV